MKLYYFPVAPNPTRVRVYLAEKGLEIPTELVNIAKGEQRQPDFLAKNPMGQLPVLELPDGRYVCESESIIEYFEERYPDPPMFGRSAEDRACARAVERHVDVCVLGGMSRYVHSTHSPLGLPPNPAVAEMARQIFEPALAGIDGWLEERPFVAGSDVTVADCTLWAALGFAKVFGLEPAPELQHVARWHEDFGRRPSTDLP